MNVTSNFDSGNIEVVSIGEDGKIDLNIRKDTESDFFQWFHFRLTGAQHIKCKISILNAGTSSYPDGWEGYNICASYDRDEWFRIPTTFKNGVLSVEYQPSYNSMYFAYFAPYSYERHQDLIHESQLEHNCTLDVIGETVEGRSMDMLVIGNPRPDKKKVWVIARQHPGESMAEWFIEGLLERLFDESDPVSKSLLSQSTFYVIPNMNPDGSIAGNLRSNTTGANLNREWETPRLKESPEVYYALKKMDELGVDMLLDVHGDEAIPYNFVAGAEGISNYTDRIKRLEESFKTHWIEICPDFQDEHNYGPDEPGSANMTVCSNQIAQRFDCLAYTIEMPFKDNDDWPDEYYGWSAERSANLGASVLQPIHKVLGQL